jgi:hypothetical protein
VSSGEVSVVAVGDGVAMGDVCVVEVAVGAGRGVAVAAGTGKGDAVGGGAVLVDSRLDCSQPAPQMLNASARVIRMKKRNLLRREMNPLCNIKISFLARELFLVHHQNAFKLGGSGLPA